MIGVKLAVVIVFHLWSLNNGRQGLAPVVIGGDDGEYYLYAAEQIGRTGVFPRDAPSVWPILVGWLMLTTGWDGTLPFKAILLAASLGTAVVGVHLLRLLAADLYRCRPTAAAEVMTAGLLVLFPSTLWVASYSIYRDAVIYFLALVAVYAAYRLLIRRQRVYGIALAAALLGLVYFRWYAALSLAAGGVVWLLLTGGGGRRRLERRLAAAAVVVVAFVGVIMTGQTTLFMDALETRDLYDYNEGGSNLGLSYSRSSVYVWPLIYTYTMITNLLGPLPNQIDGLTSLMGFALEVPFLLYVLVRLCRSRAARTQNAMLIVYMTAVWFVLIAVYNDNVGTGLRLRVLGYQFLFILFVLDVTARTMVIRRMAAWSRSARWRTPQPAVLT